MWAKVIQPGISNRGKSDEKEQWSCDLLLAKADAEAQAFIRSIKVAFVAAHGQDSRPGPKGLPYKTYLDAAGDESDCWQVTFKRNVMTRRGNMLSPPVVQDAQGTAWPRDVLIGNGSLGRVAFDTWHWHSAEGGKGISCNLIGVRVLSLIEYTEPDYSAAFGAAEAGYTLTGNEPRVNARNARPQLGPEEGVWPETASEEEVPF